MPVIHEQENGDAHMSFSVTRQSGPRCASDIPSPQAIRAAWATLVPMRSQEINNSTLILEYAKQTSTQMKNMFNLKPTSSHSSRDFQSSYYHTQSRFFLIKLLDQDKKEIAEKKAAEEERIKQETLRQAELQRQAAAQKAAQLAAQQAVKLAKIESEEKVRQQTVQVKEAEGRLELQNAQIELQKTESELKALKQSHITQLAQLNVTHTTELDRAKAPVLAAKLRLSQIEEEYRQTEKIIEQLQLQIAEEGKVLMTKANQLKDEANQLRREYWATPDETPTSAGAVKRKLSALATEKNNLSVAIVANWCSNITPRHQDTLRGWFCTRDQHWESLRNAKHALTLAEITFSKKEIELKALQAEAEKSAQITALRAAFRMNCEKLNYNEITLRQQNESEESLGFEQIMEAKRSEEQATLVDPDEGLFTLFDRVRTGPRTLFAQISDSDAPLTQSSQETVQQLLGSAI